MVSDGRGLSLDILPSGKMSWLYRYRLDGNYGKVTLGRYPDLTLRKAREKRDELAAQVASGKNPAAAEKKQRRAGGEHKPHGQRVWGAVLQRASVRRWKDPKSIRRYLDNEIFPTWRKGPQGCKCPGRASAGVPQAGQWAGSAAMQLRKVIKQIFDYAIETRLVTINPAVMVATRYIGKARKRVPRAHSERDSSLPPHRLPVEHSKAIQAGSAYHPVDSLPQVGTVARAMGASEL